MTDKFLEWLKTEDPEVVQATLLGMVGIEVRKVVEPDGSIFYEARPAGAKPQTPGRLAKRHPTKRGPGR